MDVLHLAQIVDVYKHIPKSLSPFGKIALSFDLCKSAFDQHVQYIQSIDQWKSLYNTLQKLLYYIPDMYPEWNQSQCIQIQFDDVLYNPNDISVWIHKIRQGIFNSPIG